MANNSLSVALNSKKIINGSERELRQSLAKIMMKIGVRGANLPDELGRNVLIEHIVMNYGGNTLAEIELAFDMAITGKLPVDVKCYEDFSCVYFSSIMNAYREWAVEEYDFISNKRQENNLLENKVELSDQEMMNWVNEWKEKVKLVQNPMMIPSSFYEFLDRKGLLNLSKEEKFSIIATEAVKLRHNQLCEIVQVEGNKSKEVEVLRQFNKMKSDGCFEGDEFARLKMLAKKIAVFNYLNNQL